MLRLALLRHVTTSLGLAIEWCDRHRAKGYTCSGIMGSGERWVCGAWIGEEPC